MLDAAMISGVGVFAPVLIGPFTIAAAASATRIGLSLTALRRAAA